MGNPATATIVRHRAPAVPAALRRNAANGNLHTDGRVVRWLPRRLPGWFRIGAVRVKEAA